MIAQPVTVHKCMHMLADHTGYTKAYTVLLTDKGTVSLLELF